MRHLSLTIATLMLASSTLTLAQTHRDPPLERRVAVYTRTLGLDVQQQSRLRALLIWQKDAVQRIWTDTTLTSAMRIHATQAITAAAADHIRAMLTTEQRQKYNPPPRSPGQNTPPDVERWMDMAETHK